MRVSSSGRLAVFLVSLLALAALPALASAATPAQIEVGQGEGRDLPASQGDGDRRTVDPEGGIVFEHSSYAADWAALGLAAAGVNAADAANGGPSLQDFLAAEYGSPSGEFAGPPPRFAPDEWARLSLIAHAAGLDTARVSADAQPARPGRRNWEPATGTFGGAEGRLSPQPTALRAARLLTAPTPALGARNR